VVIHGKGKYIDREMQCSRYCTRPRGGNHPRSLRSLVGYGSSSQEHVGYFSRVVLTFIAIGFSYPVN